MPESVREPVLDVAHLGHIELLTPKFEASAKFFIEKLPHLEVQPTCPVSQKISVLFFFL